MFCTSVMSRVGMKLSQCYRLMMSLLFYGKKFQKSGCCQNIDSVNNLALSQTNNPFWIRLIYKTCVCQTKCEQTSYFLSARVVFKFMIQGQRDLVSTMAKFHVMIS